MIFRSPVLYYPYLPEEVDGIEHKMKKIHQTVYRTMEKLMDDVEGGVLRLGGLADPDYIRHAELACTLVDIEGGVHSRRVHYFRNHFSRAPRTLDAMTDTILGQPQDLFRWRLLSPAATFFHMAGPGGEFNLKFTSADGHFEAVYDRAGTLLTAENDSANMGTFNYADPLTNRERHAKYDVMPYLKWHNTPDAPSTPRSIEEDMKKKGE